MINQITIYNSYGQLIRTIPFDSNVIQFRNADLTSGVYILRIETESMIFTNQIVIN